MFVASSAKAFHDNSSLCARCGEVRLLVFAILLPLFLVTAGILLPSGDMLLRILLAIQAGVTGWIAAAVAGYLAAPLLREMRMVPFPRRLILQGVQMVSYVLVMGVGLVR